MPSAQESVLGNSTVGLQTPLAQRPDRFWNFNRISWIVLAVLIAAIWGPRLFRSFWVDEAGTFWMAQGGPIAALQKTWHWPGQSLLYSALVSLFCFHSGPLREFCLRIPSLAGMLVACYYLYRIAEAAIGRGAGYLAVLLFTLHPAIYNIGTEARPYALSLAAVAGASWYLYQWVEIRDKRFLGGYLISSALIIYLHYLFMGVFLVHALYLAYVFVVERRTRDWHFVLYAYGILALVALPLLPHLRLLLQEGRTLPFRSTLPDIFELTVWFVPPITIFGLFLAAIVVKMLYPLPLKRDVVISRSTLFFFSAWLFFIPILYFAASMVSKTVIFVDRYMSFSIEADALLLAATGYLLFGAIHGRVWAILGVLLSTASPLAILVATHPGHEDLMPFMRIIRQESKTGSAPPVFFRSELPESTFNNWRGGLQGNSSHYYAPFVVYPMPNRLLPLPFHFTKEAKAYISSELDSELKNVPEIIFVTHDPKWNPWVTARMKQAGFVPVRNEQPNSFYVIVFKKAGTATPVTPSTDEDPVNPAPAIDTSN